jgi:putative SOS response-associated peptidase YedK
MCGRARLSFDVSEIKIAFGVPPERPGAEFRGELERRAGRSAPGRALRYSRGQRSLDVMRWGLIPYWAKDIKIRFSTINARAAGAPGRARRSPIRRRRPSSTG